MHVCASLSGSISVSKNEWSRKRMPPDTSPHPGFTLPEAVAGGSSLLQQLETGMQLRVVELKRKEL